MAEQYDVRPVDRQILPGVTLMTYRTDRFKVGSFSISFLLPPDPKEAPARSLLLSVLRRGNRTYPTLADINRRLDELYATPYYLLNSTRGGVHRIGFGADLLDEAYLPDCAELFSSVLSLMGQMLFYPLTEQSGTLTERYIAAEKENAIDAVRSLKNHPSAYATAQFCEAFYEEELWGQMLCGSEEQLRLITSAQLSALWRKTLAAAPIRCVYVGSLSEDVVADQLRSLLSRELSRFGRLEHIEDVRLPEAPSPQKKRPPRLLEQQLSVGQSHLILGFRTDVTLRSSEFYAMMLCHEILGLSPISRLFVYVRERLGICYSCSSDYHVDHGVLTVSCGISAQNRELAQSAILEQLEVMREGRFTDAELEAARRSLANGYRQLSDSTRSIVRFYDLRSIWGVDQSVEQCRAAFARLKREDVVAAARSLRLDMVYFLHGTGAPTSDAEQEGDGADEY